ncbi:MAG: SLBB domain-containing protein [bacterium]
MKKILLILFGILLNLNLGYSQLKGLSSFDMESMMKGDALEQLNGDQLTNTMAMPFGNVVEAESYFVGPGDIIMIQNLSSMTQKDITIVTPENKLIVPRIGEVDLKGKTLAEARELILSKITGNTKDALAFVSLYRPRNVIIEVTGNVGNPGTYTYPASYKISTIMRFANQLQSSTVTTLQQGTMLHQKIEKKKQFDELFSNSGIPYNSTFQNRNILVLHSDGSSVIADLEKAQVLNDAKYDPYIREGDRIFVPYNNMEVTNISISGSVIRPFITAFKKGDMASLLLKFGGGLQEDADMDNVRLFLPNDNQTIDLKIDEKLNLLQEDIELQPGSFIIVGQKKEERTTNSGVVSVVGNVKKPGIYQVINDKSTIKEVIEMSGGFTSEAYLPLATIIRRDASINDPKSINFQLMENFMHSSLTIYDTTRYQIDIIMREPRVACDFEALFDKGDVNSNISLRDGDIVKIPSNPKTVFVFGQVKNPGYIKFVEGKNMEWYVKKAGGYAETSNKDAARIIRGKNKIWVEGKDDILVYAGDEIYVPAPPNIPAEVKAQTWVMWSSLASTAFALLNLVYWWTRP